MKEIPDEESPARTLLNGGHVSSVPEPGGSHWSASSAGVVDDDYVSTYDHVSSIDNYIDDRLLDHHVPTIDEYLKSEHFLEFAHNLDEAIKQYDLTHDVKFDDDGPRDDHDCADVDDYCLGDFYYGSDNYDRDRYNVESFDYYAGRDDGPGRRPADPADNARPQG